VPGHPADRQHRPHPAPERDGDLGSVLQRALEHGIGSPAQDFGTRPLEGPHDFRRTDVPALTDRPQPGPNPAVRGCGAGAVQQSGQQLPDLRHSQQQRIDPALRHPLDEPVVRPQEVENVPRGRGHRAVGVLVTEQEDGCTVVVEDDVEHPAVRCDALDVEGDLRDGVAEPVAQPQPVRVDLYIRRRVQAEPVGRVGDGLFHV
jgi:hypothetical protein